MAKKRPNPRKKKAKAKKKVTRRKKHKPVDLFNKSVCYQVSFHKPGIQRKIDTEEVLAGEAAQTTRYAGKAEEGRNRVRRELRSAVLALCTPDDLKLIIEQEEISGAIPRSAKGRRAKISRSVRVGNKNLLWYCTDDELHQLCDDLGVKSKGVAATLRKRLLNAKRFRSPDQKVRGAGVDPSMLEITKDLLDSEAYRSVVRFDNQTRKYLDRQSVFEHAGKEVPALFKRGVWLISIPMIKITREGLQKRLKQREKLIDAFMAVYEVAKADAKRRLKYQYNPADYPEPAAMRSAFCHQERIFSAVLGEHVKTLEAEIFDREEKRVRKEVADLTDKIVQSLRSGYLQIVRTLAEVLAPGTDKTPNKRKLYDAHVENFMFFLNTFDGKNIANDKELGTMVKAAKKLVQGEDAGTFTDKLRTNEDFRAQAADLFAGIANGVKDLVYEDESVGVMWDVAD